jgi:hypothetical protein
MHTHSAFCAGSTPHFLAWASPAERDGYLGRVPVPRAASLQNAAETLTVVVDNTSSSGFEVLGTLRIAPEVCEVALSLPGKAQMLCILKRWSRVGFEVRERETFGECIERRMAIGKTIRPTARVPSSPGLTLIPCS